MVVPRRRPRPRRPRLVRRLHEYPARFCMSTDGSSPTGLLSALTSAFTARARRSWPAIPPDQAHVGSLVDDAGHSPCSSCFNTPRQGRLTVAGGQDHATTCRPLRRLGVTSRWRIVREESVGTGRRGYRREGPDGAFRSGQDSPYGLAAAVFDERLGCGPGVAARSSSGICHVNGRRSMTDPPMPFVHEGRLGGGAFAARSAHEFTDLGGGSRCRRAVGTNPI